MIAMSIGGDTSNVAIEKVFLANRIMPLAIQKDEDNPDSYKVLYKFNESISDNCIYFETRLLCEDELDAAYIESRSIYIENLKKDEEKMKAFKEMMKDFSETKFYMGDFNFESENLDYKINGFKQLKSRAGTYAYEHMAIYIPRYIFIIISLYIDDFLNPYNDVEKEFLFVSGDMLNMRFEKVEHVKLVNSSKYEEGNCFHYPTMYEMNCGPTFWKFVYEIISQDDLELKKSIDYSKFDSKYSEYKKNLIGVVDDRKYIYVVTVNENDKIVALKIDSDLVNKTNLKDPYFIFNLPKELEEESNDNE